jgi:hypothetical protein
LPGCRVGGGGVWLWFAGGPGVRGVRDVWSCSYSGAGPRPLFVARALSKVERARSWWGWVLRRQIAELCARAGIARAASRAATSCGG